jgi:hypothetical protein
MRAIWPLGALVSGTVACELIVGIGTAPHLAVGDAGDAGGDGQSPVCTLPTTGDAKVRFANVVPSLSSYDFCLTPTSSQPTGNGVLASSGTGCPAGLLYRNALAPFAVPSGSYTVSAVAPGAACTSTPLASAPSVNFDSGTTTTVVLFGTDNAAQLQMKALREEEGTVAGPTARFVNAWSDGPSSLECGATTSDELPANIIPLELFGQNTSFGNAAPPSMSVDALGYFTLTPGVTLNFGFAQTGMGVSAGVAVVRPLNTLNTSLSIYAIGTSADPRFPVDLMLCNQDQVDGIYTRCSNQIPDDVIVTVFNAQLQGRFTPTENERRMAVYNAIAGLDSNFACITEVWDPTDQQAIITAAKAHFPYSATFTTDFNTVATDPRDQMGNVPPPYTTPPCDSTGASLQQAFLSCLAANCNTSTPNDTNGQIPEDCTQCVENNCITPGANLLVGEPACYSCTVTQLESGVTFANTQTACTTNPLARYAFNGGQGIVLLSTYPFIDTGSSDAGVPADGGTPADDAPGLYVFPATEYRAGMIRAPVDLSGGTGVSTKLDVYCAILTTPATSPERPYTGNYGGGGMNLSQQWLNEQILQTQKLTAYVKSVSGARKRRAVIAGDYYAGASIGGLDTLNQPSYDSLTGVLPLAIAPAYTPACNYCGSNPLVAGGGAATANIWSSYSLLSDLAVTEVQSNTVILQALTATVDPALFGLPTDGGLLSVPASFYYGVRTVVRVRP